MRKWNLLMASANHGIAGAINDHHAGQPKCYERVPVVAIEDVIEKIQAFLDPSGEIDDLTDLLHELEQRKP